MTLASPSQTKPDQLAHCDNTMNLSSGFSASLACSGELIYIINDNAKDPENLQVIRRGIVSTRCLRYPNYQGDKEQSAAIFSQVQKRHVPLHLLEHEGQEILYVGALGLAGGAPDSYKNIQVKEHSQPLAKTLIQAIVENRFQEFETITQQSDLDTLLDALANIPDWMIEKYLITRNQNSGINVEQNRNNIYLLNFRVNSETVYQKVEIQTPENTRKANLDDLLKCYDHCYPKAKLEERIGLQILIANIKNRRPFISTPPEGSVELLRYYKSLENTILGYTSFLLEKKESGELQDYAPFLQDLSNAGKDCGTKQNATAIAILNQMYTGKGQSLDVIVLERLQNLRFEVFEETVYQISGTPLNSEIDVHIWQKTLKFAHQLGFNIAGSEGADYEDINAPSNLSIDQFQKVFSEKYTPQRIATALHQSLKLFSLNEEKREILIGALKDFVPVSKHDISQQEANEIKISWVMEKGFSDDWSVKSSVAIRVMEQLNLVEKQGKQSTDAKFDEQAIFQKALRYGYDHYVNHMIESNSGWISVQLEGMGNSDKRRLALMLCKNHQDMALITVAKMKPGLEMVRTLTKMGVHYHKIGNIQLVTSLLLQAEKMSAAIPEPLHRSRAFWSLSEIRFSIGQQRMSVHSASKAIQSAKLIENLSFKLNELISMGLAFQDKGQRSLAQTALKSGLGVLKEHQHIDQLFSDFMQVAILAKAREDESLFEQVCTSALIAGKRFPREQEHIRFVYFQRLILSISLMGDSKQVEKAIKYTISSLKPNGNESVAESLAECFEDRSRELFGEGFVDMALEVMKVALSVAKQIRRKSGDQNTYDTSFISSSLFYEAVNLFKSNQIDDALNILRLSVEAIEACQSDTARVKEYTNMGQLLLRNGKINWGNELIGRAVILIRKMGLKFLDQKIKWLSIIIESYLQSNQIEKAINMIEEIRKETAQLKDPYLCFKAHMNLGNTFNKYTQTFQAKELYLTALKEDAVRVSDSYLHARAFSITGKALVSIGENLSAKDLILKSTKEIETVHNPKKQAQILQMNSKVFFDLDDKPKAIETLNKAYQRSKNINEPKLRIKELVMTAELYFAMGDEDTSNRLTFKIEKELEALKNDRNNDAYAEALFILAKTFFNQDEIEKAIEQITKLFGSFDDPRSSRVFHNALNLIREQWQKNKDSISTQEMKLIQFYLKAVSKFDDSYSISSQINAILPNLLSRFETVQKEAFFEQMVSVLNQVKDDQQQVQSFLEVSKTCHKLKESEWAIQLLESAKEKLNKISDASRKSHVILKYVRICLSIGGILLAKDSIKFLIEEYSRAERFQYFRNPIPDLFHVIFEIQNTEQQSAIKNELINQIMSMDASEKKVNLLLETSSAISAKGEKDKALEMLGISLEIIQFLQGSQATFYARLVNQYEALGEKDKVTPMLDLAFESALSNQNSEELRKSFVALGVLTIRTQFITVEMQSRLNYYVSKAEKIDDPYRRALALSGLEFGYANWGEIYKSFSKPILGKIKSAAADIEDVQNRAEIDVFLKKR